MNQIAINNKEAGVIFDFPNFLILMIFEIFTWNGIHIKWCYVMPHKSSQSTFILKPFFLNHKECLDYSDQCDSVVLDI